MMNITEMAGDFTKQKMLSTMKTAGFRVPFSHGVENPTFEGMLEETKRLVAESAYELDGIVLDVNQDASRGFVPTAEQLNPPYACKIKVSSGDSVTTVTSVEWAVSKDGFLKPVVHFEPVSLSGVTIRKASGYNARNIVEMGIGTGAVVKITRRGDVIPCVEECLLSADVVLPEGEWNESGADLMVVGEHSDMLQRKLEYFFSKMEVDFMGPGNVAKLIENGIQSVTEAILLQDQYEGILGELGRKATISLKEKMMSTTPQRLCAALGLFGRGMGERKLKTLFETCNYEMVMKGLGVNTICMVDGFEEKSAQLIVDNLHAARAVLSKLDGFYQYVKPKDAKAVTGKLTGQIFCATGVRLSEPTISKITAQGGTVTESFGKSVTTLVAKDPNSSSGKAVKAKAMGMKIISLAQLEAML